jgi:hypothetical protein
VADQIKVTQNVAQIETLPLPNGTVNQLIAQVETRATHQLKTAQILAQVEYVLGAGGAPGQEQLLRHGTYFNASGKQRFWWAR